MRVWRLADGAPVGEPLTGHAGAVNAVAVGALPDGTPVIVSGSGDYRRGQTDTTVRVWRLADGAPVGEPLTGHPGPVNAVAVGALPDREHSRVHPPFRIEPGESLDVLARSVHGIVHRVEGGLRKNGWERWASMNRTDSWAIRSVR